MSIIDDGAADSDDDDRVGYRRPPKATQFKPGQSGNPNGRPRRRQPDGPASWIDDPVAVRVNGAVEHRNPRELALRKQISMALKDDDPKAQRYLLDLFGQHGAYDTPVDPQTISGGVLTLSNPQMPFRMEYIMMAQMGPPPWSDAQLAEGRRAYLAERSEQQARIDEAIGYLALRGGKEDAR